MTNPRGVFNTPITFIDTIFVLLLGLKLTVRPDLSWWVVAAPEFFPFALYIVSWIVSFIVELILLPFRKKPDPLAKKAAEEFSKHYNSCVSCQKATWRKEMDVHSVLDACATGRALWKGLQDASAKAYPNA